ncbi:MAG TPA: helix-turn-helix domain-containing protein [Pseudolabrys sp.]|nr:helix-turn-helix domain-containing protein [Pseudolabrys sp.]
MKVAEARPYIMRARAEAAAITRSRILTSACELLVQHSFEDMTIEAVAEGAGTTTRTVLRIFGSKEEVFAHALHSLGQFGQAPITPDNLDALISGTYDFYDKIGDTVVRWLADEPRIPAMHKHLNIGRQHLRAWVAAAFEPTLNRLSREARKEVHDALVIAFDIYTWKLLRRDFGLSRRGAHARLRRIVAGITRENNNG